MRRDAAASRQLAWRLLVRNISARYRQTALGYTWAFLPPLATTVTFVFLRDQAVFEVGETSIPYAPFVLIGTTLWLAFADALLAPLRMLESVRDMVAKINFPREALILAAALEVAFDTVVRSALVVVVLLAYQILPPATVLLVPLGMVALIALGIVVGLLVTPVGILYQDVPRGLTLLTVFWMFLTPVLYPLPPDGPAGALATLNPVTPLLDTSRAWLTTGSAPQLGAALVITAGTAVALALGWVLLRVAMPHLVARLGE